MSWDYDDFELSGDYLGSILYIFYHNHKKYMKNKLSDYGLSIIQAFCIVKVHNNELISQKDLSDEFALTKGAITKAITQLEDDGIIIRTVNELDRRQYFLELTDRGESLIPVLMDINKEWRDKMGLEDIDPIFIETFIDLTKKSIFLNIST